MKYSANEGTVTIPIRYNCVMFPLTMTSLGHLRRNRRLSRSVFALFVLACLQTMMVPCVMANDLADHAMTGQAQHATSSRADMKDCIYCPPHSASDPAHSGMPGCAYPHDAQSNDNAHQIQFEQFNHVTWMSSSPLTMTISLDNDIAPPRYLAVRIAQRPLNLTHCVQLK